MERITIKFQSIPDLVDFQLTTGNLRCNINPDYCTLTGVFSEADIELAMHGYGVQVMNTAAPNQRSLLAFKHN